MQEEGWGDRTSETLLRVRGLAPHVCHVGPQSLEHLRTVHHCKSVQSGTREKGGAAGEKQGCLVDAQLQVRAREHILRHAVPRCAPLRRAGARRCDEQAQEERTEHERAVAELHVKHLQAASGGRTGRLPRPAVCLTAG